MSHFNGLTEVNRVMQKICVLLTTVRLLTIFKFFQKKIPSYTFKILNIKYSENHYTLTLKLKIDLAQTEVSDAKLTIINEKV